MKILLVTLSQAQYDHHIEYWTLKGHMVIATTSLDEVCLHMERDKDIDVVLIEPVLSKPVDSLLEKRITDHTPQFSAQSSGEKAFGMMFWFNVLRGKEDKTLTLFLATKLEKKILLRDSDAARVGFINVPSGPEEILKQVMETI